MSIVMDATPMFSGAAELPAAPDVRAIVHRILAARAIDRPVRADDDLRQVGLTSLDMVNLVLSVEAEFGVTIPEAAITPAKFRSIAAIEALVATLRP